MKQYNFLVQLLPQIHLLLKATKTMPSHGSKMPVAATYLVSLLYFGMLDSRKDAHNLELNIFNVGSKEQQIFVVANSCAHQSAKHLPN